MSSGQKRFHSECVGHNQDPGPRHPSHPWSEKEPHQQPWTLVDEWYMEKRALRQSREVWHRAAEYRLRHLEETFLKTLMTHPHPVLQQLLEVAKEEEEEGKARPNPDPQNKTPAEEEGSEACKCSQDDGKEIAKEKTDI